MLYVSIYKCEWFWLLWNWRTSLSLTHKRALTVGKWSLYGWSPLWLEWIWPKKKNMKLFVCGEVVEYKQVKLESTHTYGHSSPLRWVLSDLTLFSWRHCWAENSKIQKLELCNSCFLVLWMKPILYFKVLKVLVVTFFTARKHDTSYS